MGLLDKLYPRPVKPEHYSRLIIDEFYKHGISATVSADNPFELRLEDNSQVFLNNAYALYCKASNAERAEKISFFVSAQLPHDRTLTKANLHRLCPVVRSSAYYSLTELINRADGRTDGSEYAHAPLAPGIAVGLALDSEKSMTLVRRRDLEAVDLSFDEALKMATENLEKNFDHTLIEHAPGLYIGDWADGYASSRILLPSVWRSLSIKGIPLLHLPSRDKFFVIDASDPHAADLALTLGEEEHNGAYPLSPDVFLWREDKWLCGVLRAGEAKSIQNRMVQNRLALDYAQQKELLDKIYEQEHIDVFVASYTLYETADPPAQFSVSVWSKGIPTLLPITDQVTLLVDVETKDTLRVSLLDLRKVCEETMRRVKDLYPIRFQLFEFPSDARLEQLRELAIVSP